jgi:hypothetical protein
VHPSGHVVAAAERGKVQQRGTGIVDGDVQREPPAAAQLREIIRNGLR